MEFVLGTANFGLAYGTALSREHPGLSDVGDRLRTADALGVRVLDTASAYGDAEIRIGELLADSVQDHAFSISTKTDPSLGQSAESFEDLAAQTTDSTNQSLQRLRVSSVDQVLLHRWDQFHHCDQAIWKALCEMQKSGLIRRIGVSVQSPQEMISALQSAEIETVQLACNVLDWRYDTPELQAALDARLGTCRIEVRSVFLQGLLTLQDGVRFPRIDAPYDERAVRDWLVGAADKLANGNLTAFCLRFARSLPWADALVIGVDNADQLADLVGMLNTPPLPEKDMAWVRKTRPVLPVAFLDPAQWK